MTWSETKALIEDGVVSNDWIGRGLFVAVKRDDHRPICVFRDEVYEVWERSQSRTSMAGTVELRRIG